MSESQINNNMKEKNRKKFVILNNIKYILFYALSLSVALGFNDLVITIFNGFPTSHHIISKTTYIIIMFGLTLLIAYYFSNITMDKNINNNYNDNNYNNYNNDNILF